ncbi:hypothetical protein RI570_06655 [Brucella pseudogrignonensis]|uniref:hypothetical protein n=1 Tax=Brucella pseudogrignonensis TaxID=419475 RepID=UPI0028B778F0|nr:hypothetical protein [Brucella pseudogrignonensis]MDT6939823.1 hypothetical protein [Brucella pseudogrignonensis]
MLNYNDNRFKYIFAHSFFAQPADTNYLLARYTKINFIFSEFYWQSAQAIEKYLKAGLILNGHSSKKLQHDLTNIWGSYKRTYKRCPVPEFEKPVQLNSDLWDSGSLDDFINRINKYGDIDCRYGLVSYDTFPTDLFKLDALIFELKRRVVGLNWLVGKDWDVDLDIRDYEGMKYSHLIQSKKEYIGTEFEPLKKGNNGTALDIRDSYYSWNFTLQPEKTQFPPAPKSISSPIGHMKNTALQMLWNSIIKAESPTDYAKKVEWILNNVKMKSDDVILLANKVGLDPKSFIKEKKEQCCRLLPPQQTDR